MLTPKFLNIRFLFILNLLSLSGISANDIKLSITFNTDRLKTEKRTSSVDDLLTQADVLFKKYQFVKAIGLYDEILKKVDEPSTHIIQNLADSYFNLSNYAQAGIWYSRLYEMQQGNFNENYLIKYVQCLKANRQNRQADELLVSFYENKNRLKSILFQKQHLKNLGRKNEKYTISHLDFNSKASDASPALCKDGLIFISSRGQENNNNENLQFDHKANYELYKIWPEESAVNVEKYSNIVNASNYEPSLTFSRDSKTVYFTRTDSSSINLENSNNLQIFSAAIRNNELTDVKSLSFNSKAYSCKQPSISADGKFLYFSSDMPGGFGESDIYKVALNNNGDAISEPINLGVNINTAGREEYPFVEGQQIYFSSDAHYGMGGLDIFSAQILPNKEYSIPLNMGTPVNSSMDDFSFIAERSRNNAYFSSNRPGGIGGNDIYHLLKKEELTYQEYSGYVIDETTKEPIANARIRMNSLANRVNFIFQTDANGFYKLKLPANNQYNITFQKENYTRNNINIETSRHPSSPSINNTIYLTPTTDTMHVEQKSASLNLDNKNI